MIPVEFSYNPWNYDNFLYLSFYGRLGWQFIQSRNIFQENMFTDFFSGRNDIYGTIGTRLLFFPSFGFYYSPRVAVLFEYNTSNELKLGFSLDLSAIIGGILLAWKEGVEEDRINIWERRPGYDKERRDKPKSSRRLPII
jgi:hypothetical protein